MSRTDLLKWIYSFYLLTITMAWGAFTVMVVFNAMNFPSPANVLEAAGASTLTGALLTWNGLVVIHWFRKKNPEEGK